MTKAENNLLSELKKFFNSKYGTEWEAKFKTYTNKLVEDGQIDKEIIEEFLDDEEPNEIVKRFKSFSKSSPQVQRPSQTYGDGCGSSGRTVRIDGCGSTPSRSISRSTTSDGCGSSGSSNRSSC